MKKLKKYLILLCIVLFGLLIGTLVVWDKRSSVPRVVHQNKPAKKNEVVIATPDHNLTLYYFNPQTKQLRQVKTNMAGSQTVRGQGNFVSSTISDLFLNNGSYRIQFTDDGKVFYWNGFLYVDPNDPSADTQIIFDSIFQTPHKPILQGGYNFDKPAWQVSHDGKTIYFVQPVTPSKTVIKPFSLDDGWGEDGGYRDAFIKRLDIASGKLETLTRIDQTVTVLPLLVLSQDNKKLYVWTEDKNPWAKKENRRYDFLLSINTSNGQIHNEIGWQEDAPSPGCNVDGTEQLSPDGRYFIGAIGDQSQNPKLQLFDLRTGQAKTLLTLQANETPLNVQWSPNGQQILINFMPCQASGTSISLYDLSTNKITPLVQAAPPPQGGNGLSVGYQPWLVANSYNGSAFIYINNGQLIYFDLGTMKEYTIANRVGYQTDLGSTLWHGMDTVAQWQ